MLTSRKHNISLNQLEIISKIGKNRPTPFYISLRMEGSLIHNFLVDTGGATTIMLKVFCEAEFKLY